MGLVDTVYTFRFLKILSTKWEDTDAYKLNIIDADGTPLKKSTDLLSNKEKDAYTVFIRLIFKLKRMMGKIPGGKSAVARYGAALLLIKEHKEEVEEMGINITILEEGLKRYIQDEYESLNEEVSTGVSGVEGKDQGLGKSKMHKRKKTVEEDDYEDDYEEEEEDQDENYDPSYSYQVIGGVLIRVDEKAEARKRVIKKRVLGGSRQKKREFKSGANSKWTRTGNRKLRGGALAKKRRSLRKANRKAKTGSAKAKRKRSTRKSNKYN